MLLLTQGKESAMDLIENILGKLKSRLLPPSERFCVKLISEVIVKEFIGTGTLTVQRGKANKIPLFDKAVLLDTS